MFSISITISLILIIISCVVLFRKWVRGARVPSALLQQQNLRDKTVVITGASAGIGLETAKVLCSTGATIIMGCRNTTKGAQAAHVIREYATSQHSHVDLHFHSHVTVLPLDLASFASIRAFAASVLDKCGSSGIDILINNAGIIAYHHDTTQDGFEIHFGVNYLGHFLLTQLLLDHIRKVNGRIINVSAHAHKMADIYWDLHQNNGASLSIFKLYAQSKLCNILFTYELNRRYSNLNNNNKNKNESNCIKTFALHPGVIDTEIS